MPELRDVLLCDRQQLITLWADVFGDPPALPDAFLTRLPEMGFGWAAVGDGRVLGAAYGVDALCVAGEKTLYLYAVAVRPEARGEGLGAALSRAVFETGRERGAVYRCTRPAELSLFASYGKILGVGCVLCRESVTVRSEARIPVRRIAPEEYAALRGELLAAVPHMCCGAAAMDYEAINCTLFGGALFAANGRIAAAQVEGDTVLLRECLGPDREAFAASVGAALGCRETQLLTAAERGEPFLAGDRPFPTGTVWNLAFD